MQTIIDAWFVQGMIKATSDAWLKGWDERNGGNLTLRLDEADIEPTRRISTPNRAISPSASRCQPGQPAVYRHRLRQILP